VAIMKMKSSNGNENNGMKAEEIISMAKMKIS